MKEKLPIKFKKDKVLPLSYRHLHDQTVFEFQQDGLEILVYENAKETPLQPYPQHTFLGDMDFAPGGHYTAIRDKTSEYLLLGIESLTQFFAELDQQGLPEPEYLHAVTNKQMATAVKRLGFTVEEIMQETRKKNAQYQISATTALIKEKLDELNRREIDGRNIRDILRSRIVR